MDLKGCYSQQNEDYSITINHNRVEISRPIGSSLNLLYYTSSDVFYLCDSYLDFSRWFPLRINPCAEHSILKRGYCYPPETLVESVFKVPLLATLVVAIHDGVLVSELQYGFKSICLDGVNIENLHETINDSSQGESCIMFSGGLDSTLLYRLLQDRIHSSFSSGFEFESVDLIEKQYSLTAAQSLGMRTTYCSYDFHDLLCLIPDIICASEEPICHIQSLLIMAMIKEHNEEIHGRAIINGQGADALFGLPSGQYESVVAMEEHLRPTIVLAMDAVPNMRTEAKNYYLNIIGDVDHTVHCWQSCAKYNGQKMCFPLFNESVFKLLRKPSSVDQIGVNGESDKFILKKLAREVGIPQHFIERQKVSFGPRSTSWGKTIANCLHEPYHSNQRYMLWNKLNLLIWKNLIIEGKNKDQVIKYVSL